MLALALILDAALGEPRLLWDRIPHPAVLMGRLVGWLDRGLNHGHGRRAKGTLALTGLILLSGSLGAILAALPLIGPALEVLGAAILLAQRSLIEHVRDVATALRQGLAEGRRAVSMIVGRDPETLDEAATARAAIESAAENFSDGVVAPAFWFALAGLPGIAVYKAVNTADSMIGHRTRRYEAFGWASARFDDLLNLVPARAAGWLICLAGGGWYAARVMRRDARRHKSPNAGWPESAMAASLGLSLAGPRIYGGKVTPDPYLHPEGRASATPEDIEAACRLLWRAWAALLGLAALVWALS
ncbi:MAG: adenosylcobinamide-phosphate synthase CbiB [Pseudomonadota bacterium]